MSDYKETGMIPLWGDASVMFGLSQNLITLTEGYVTALQSAAMNIFPPNINVDFPSVSSPPRPVTVPLPALLPVATINPTLPAAFSGSLDIGNLLPGPFNVPQPTLSFPSAPTPFSGSVPTSPPIDLNFVYPDVQIQLPYAPALLSLDVVTFDPLVIPTFDVTVPTLTLSPPSPVAYTEKAAYTSTVLSALQASLLSAMTDNTDTGLSAATQQAMWDAAREREMIQQAAALASLDRDTEVLGYALPPGVFIDARIKIQTETSRTLSGLSRDIMVKQAELRLENVTKARELSVGLEGKLIDYYNQVAQRTFEAAKYYTEAAINIYNAQVQAFTVKLRGYEVQATVYDTQIKGILANVQYKQAQIDFEKTKAEINSALINQYKIEVDASLATLEVYKTQVQIIQVQAQIEKTKVDVFAAQIQAFTGQVNAYTAQVDGYKAVIESQTAIENVYKTQVEAYSAEVSAGVAAAGALIAQFKGRIEAYTAQLDGFKAQLQAQVAVVQAEAAYNTSLVEEFKGEVSAVTAYNQALTSQWEAVVNEQVQIAQVAAKVAEANGQLYISARQLSIDASKAGAQVAAQLGAAALNAIHWSNSASWSLGVSSVISNSNSTSTSTNSNYNSSV